jgi:hydroxyethylthiazole kinase-like uncharacterized protein yjeF
MYISTVRQMRELDARAIGEYGITEDLLMENAGEAVYYTILRHRGVRDRCFLVVSGPGNNGGDGFVVARKLHSTGAKVRVALLADPASYGGPSERNLSRLRKSGLELLIRPGSAEVTEALAWCDCIVDGLLGTGLTRDVDGLFAEMVWRINDSQRTVFSVDIPSGVDGNTGQVRGAAIAADVTVTFGLPKLGNVLGPGATLGGRLYLSHISFPPRLIADAGIKVALNEPCRLPRTRASESATKPPASNSEEPVPTLGETFRIVQPDELLRLAAASPDETRQYRISSLQQLCGDLDATVVLQENRALIGLPDGRVFVNPSGNSRGDYPVSHKVIYEAICLLRDRGLPMEDAVRTGVFLEGVAADLSARACVTTSPRAQDHTENLSRAIQMLEGDYYGLTSDYYGTLEVI